MITAQTTITEAKTISDSLIEAERGQCAGNVEVAIHRVSQKYGVAGSALKALRYRWRELKSIPAHLLENLRAIDEAIYDAQRCKLQREIELSKFLASKLDTDIAGSLDSEIERLGLLYPPVDTKPQKTD